MSEAKPKDELIGKTLGQYEIVEEIGRGGMATVYRARQISINRTVAIKVLPRNLLHDPSFYERFEREVDVIAHLEHPHILPIYDYGNADGIPYIVMRYLGGGSLAQWIRRGVPRLEDIERPFSQVAQALDYAHQRGIIHRDIKPGNVILDENGNAYLSDFGIARIMDSNLTGSAIIGTPAYMSPEQANGQPLDARSDVYALGIVLFELITGREPYQAETPMALLLKHINEPVPPLNQFRPGVPLSVENVISVATAKQREQRYASAGAMAAAYSEALRGAQGATPPPMQVEDAPTIAPGTPLPLRQTPYPPAQPPYATPYPPYPATGPAPTPYPPPAPPRSPLPLILGGLLVVAALVIGGLLVVPNLQPPEAPVTLVAATLPPPTAFSRASVVQNALYSIAVPSSWRYVDLTGTDGVLRHYWDDRVQGSQQAASAYVTLELIETDVTTPQTFSTAVETYARAYLAPAIAGGSLLPIDEAAAPDGTLRRSFRRPAAELESGQMDVFFIARGPYLAVVQMFSGDSQGSALVPTFQQVLDSLRVKSA
jgi:serine/threonine-protein kinase